MSLNSVVRFHNHRDLLSRIEEAEVVSLCRDLVRLKSVNPPGDELEIAEYVAGILRKAGLAADVVPHTPTRASVVARLKGSGEVPALLYSGHLDVVPIGPTGEDWLYDPFGGEVAEGKLWGRGSTDMKSGVAAMIEAARVLAAAKLPLKGDLVLVFTADEEVGALGARELATRPDLAPAQAVVISEPSYNDVYVAEKGQFWLEITTYGKAAHGSMPHLGQNAIMMMVALLDKLDQLQVPYEEHPLLGGFTRSIGTIHGGLSTNIVPDCCVATVDLRTLPGQDHRMILRQVEDLIADLSRQLPGFRASVKVVIELCPVETSPQNAAVQSFCDVVAEVTGERPEPKGVPYGTDAAFLVPPLNAAMVLCGPGNPDLAHQLNECVEVDKLIESARIFTLAAAQFLA
jgi:succinyl-diaminopimelate desuccinylase